MALRSRLRPSSIASRNGSQKLLDRAGFESFGLESLNSTPNPVVTSSALAGFQVTLIGRGTAEASSSRALAPPKIFSTFLLSGKYASFDRNLIEFFHFMFLGSSWGVASWFCA